LFLAAAVPAAAQGRRPPEIRFTVDPSPVVQGRTFTVRFQGPATLKNPRMTLGKRTAYFFPVSTGTWRALWGVSSQEEPGPKEARFEALWRKTVLVSTVSFTVEGGTFPLSRIPLSKSQDRLFTSGQLEKDNKALSAAWSVLPSPEKQWSGYFVMPTTGVISSVFGARRAYGKRPPGSGHSGTDIANDEGTLITAPARGRVVFSRWLDSFGNAVVLDHGQGLYTYYLHMKEALVHEGDFLVTGAPIGLMGKEGIATGPHLHWSMVVAGERVSAMEWTERAFD
jgi:murein DD-endopeptidase MepM/ murein hydrolase activator NlpD